MSTPCRARRNELGDAEIVVVTFASPRCSPAIDAASPTHSSWSLTKSASSIGHSVSVEARSGGSGAGSQAKKYVELLREGHRLEKTDADARQLGGNVVVGRDGRLAWVYAGAGPDDRPTVDQIAAALRAEERPA